TNSGDCSDDHMCAARWDSHASDRRSDECLSEDRSVADSAPDHRSSGYQADVRSTDNRTDCCAGTHSTVNGSPQTPATADPAQTAGMTGTGLAAIDLDVTQIPDLVPVLAAVMSAAEGNSVITGAERLRIKESDRLETVRDFLSRLGADIECLDDGLSITGMACLAGGEVSSHNDHRIAMAAAVASCICRGPVVIRGADAVSKSYPDFFSDFAGLGGTVSEI
ncbi:MAG: 3-phosphoshikimate 1-carboxyvinyltransferase, partial [Anaerovoracaceae bacterium]